MNRANIVVATLVGLAALTACEKRPTITPPLTAVTYTPIEQKDVTVRKTWVGLLDGYQNADIRAQVTGYLLTQNYKEGSVVKKGETLFTIDPRTFQAALAQAQADYSKAVSQAQLAQITLDRQTQLYKTKVISQQEYDTSYQNTQASVATVAAAQAQVQTAQINLNYCTITAPFDGIAGVAQAQIGDLVGPGGTASVLTQMSQVNPIKVNFSITEQEYLQAYPLLQKLQAMPVENRQGKLALNLADGTLYPEAGQFDFVNRQVTASTGSIQITGIFPNPDDLLRPGLFARVTAPVQELKDALVVPQAATVELQGNYFVQVLQPDETATAVPVKLGPVDGQLQVITGKVEAGMKVLVGGVEKARPGMKLNAQPYTPPPAPSPSPTSEKAAQPLPTPAPTPEATATPEATTTPAATATPDAKPAQS